MNKILTEKDVILKLQCKRCTHEWFPKRTTKPKVCPKCKSPYWNRERTKKKARK